VAVTTSLVDPKKDFEINAGGTLNVLEAIRLSGERIPLLFTSTNKVYGHLEHVALERMDRRYVPVDSSVRFQGIDERTPLSFHSPYGCSKGAADQYVCDYARCFGIPTCVFRMSCIYGPHQFGTEDQGWVAHFLLRALAHERLTLFGDGMQVRDILYVDDLVEAFLAALSHMDKVKGGAFNMGGGPTNTVSLLELLRLIAARTGRRPDVAVENWRVGDQRYYVSNTRRFELLTGWRARVSVEEGIRRLHDWLLKFSPLLQIAKTLEAGLHPVLHGGAH
jgi:CDP-paratose 2-epimerase